MSMDAVNTTANKTNIAGEIGTSVAFSGVLTGGFGSFSSIKRNGGISKAIQATKANNELLKKFAEENKNCDVFTRSLRTSSNYGEYVSLLKKQAKLEKLAKKAEKGKLSIWQNVKNIFKKDKVTTNAIIENKEVALAELKNKKSLLESGKDIAKEAEKYAANKGFASDAKTLFKSELKNPFVVGITLLSALPRIKEEIIPAFKNEGFISGIKTTFKVAARTGADLVSNAGFSAVGRILGTVAGTVFGPAGCAIGGTIGDIVGSFFSMKLVDKLFGKEEVKAAEDTETVQNEIAQGSQILQNEEYQTAETVQPQNIETTQAHQISESQTDNVNKNTSKYEGMTSRYKGPRAQKADFVA